MYNECMICLDTITKPTRAGRCNHVFCTECLLKWIEAIIAKNNGIHPHCPTCRRDIEKSDLSLCSRDDETLNSIQALTPHQAQIRPPVTRENSNRIGTGTNFTIPPLNFERRPSNSSTLSGSAQQTEWWRQRREF